jgi:hypothetical protein
MYKNKTAFETGEGVCYISEPDFRTGEEFTYTRDEFIEVCKGDVKMAEHVFKHITWEFPETLYLEELWEVERGNLVL